MNTHFPLLSLHVAVLLFGAAGLMGTIIDLPPSLLVLGRTSFGALALWLCIACWHRGSKQYTDCPTFLFSLCLSGAVLSVHWWAFFYAIQLAGVGIALVGFSAFPAFVIALERLFNIRPSRRGDGVVTVMVMVGLWFVAPSFTWHDQALQGLVLGVLSGGLFAVLTLQNQRLIQTIGGMVLGAWQQGMAALLCLVWVLVAGVFGGDVSNSIQTLTTLQPNDWVLLAILGVLLTALPHVLFIRSLTWVSAHMAAIAATLEPIYGILLAWWFIAEIPQPTTLAGMAVIIIAVYINLRFAKTTR